MKAIKLTNNSKIVVSLILLLVLLSFSERKMNEQQSFINIEVAIQNNENNHYLDDVEVVNAVNAILQEDQETVNLKEVEQSLLENPYIQKAEVYRDLKNQLLVKVRLRRPLARLIREKRSHAYISYDGALLPISSKYTSRVPLISGKYAEDFNRDDMFQKDDDKRVYQLLKKIESDEFFKAQVAQLDIDEKLNVSIYPQVTKQIVEFGQPENIDEKFRKLLIFYKEILPEKGWNDYKRVNVEFEGQIVAE